MNIQDLKIFNTYMYMSVCVISPKINTKRSKVQETKQVVFQHYYSYCSSYHGQAIFIKKTREREREDVGGGGGDSFVSDNQISIIVRRDLQSALLYGRRQSRKCLINLVSSYLPEGSDCRES